MTEDNKLLLTQAEYAKGAYISRMITREEAKEMIMPYINAYNAKAKEIAKKYNMRAKTITFTSFMR